MSQNAVSSTVVNFDVSRNTLDTINAIKINGGGRGRSEWTGYALVKTSLYAVKDLCIGRYTMAEPGFFLVSDVRIGENVGFVSPVYKGTKVNAPKREWMPVDRLEDQFFIGSWGNLEDPEVSTRKFKTSRKLSLMNLIMSGEGITLVIGSGMRDIAQDQLEKITVGGSEAIEMTNTSIRSKIVNDKAWKRGKDTNVEDLTELMIPLKDGEAVDMLSITEPRLIPVETKSGSPMKPKWWVPTKANNVKNWSGFQGVITTL